MKTIFANPQWQGGADIRTMYGVWELESLYLQGARPVECPVSKRRDELDQTADIRGFSVLKKQMAAASGLLRAREPETLFSVGGSCDADVPVIDYLNRKFAGDLAVLWIDAHGDLNAPEESVTKLYYGMPARTLLDGGIPGFYTLAGPALRPAQLINVGGRDFDPAETRCMEARSIRHLTAAQVTADPSCVREAVRLAGFGHVYIHLDLDALDPLEFPYTSLPVKGGLPFRTLREVFTSLRAGQPIPGFGLYEYTPCCRTHPIVSEIVDFALTC